VGCVSESGSTQLPTFQLPAARLPESAGTRLSGTVVIGRRTVVLPHRHPLLVIILVGALLMWKWDDFFGSDDADNAQAPQAAATESQESGGDDSNGSGSDEESTEAAESEGADSADSADSDAANGARPKEADLPAGSEPVNAAARNDEPAGNFNNIYKSPQVGDSYTSDDFAEAVRDAFVDAYLEDKEIDHVLDVYSDAARRSIEMTCRDAGSYVHCSGGNNANVYIA
jgi:hypothetical protein